MDGARAARLHWRRYRLRQIRRRRPSPARFQPSTRAFSLARLQFRTKYGIGSSAESAAAAEGEREEVFERRGRAGRRGDAESRFDRYHLTAVSQARTGEALPHTAQQRVELRRPGGDREQREGPPGHARHAMQLRERARDAMAQPHPHPTAPPILQYVIRAEPDAHRRQSLALMGTRGGAYDEVEDRLGRAVADELLNRIERALAQL